MTHSLAILYGSETGCAQDVADNLARQARRRHFRTRVIAMDDYDKSQLIEEKLVIFVCSTTGQGEEPNNMKKFWKFLLRKNLPHDILNELDCAVFGLGDSSYRKFNYPAKKLYKRLLQLGANMLIERGDGDDQHYLGLDGAFIPWAQELWMTIMNKYPLEKEAIPDDVLLPPSIQLQSIDQAVEYKHVRLEGEYDLTVTENTRITAMDHFQDVRHVEFTTSDIDFSYEPGDIAVMMPQNIPEEVDLFLEQMGWSDIAHQSYKLLPTQDHTLPTHWPAIITFRDLFIYHLDIFGVPRRSFFEMLAYFTLDSNHTERLREFCTAAGQEDMWAYCYRLRRTVAEVLFDFKPFQIPLDYILDVFPQLQPRSFSIASSISVHPHKMQLCVAIVKYKTKMRKIRRGVFTKYLTTLQTGDIVHSIKIVKGTMQLPPVDVPLIAIGPGTGVAPMRCFLEERLHSGAQHNILIFGCRNKDKDYYYREQWEQHKDQLQVMTAFSRDQEEKVYVQDKIREHGALLWHWIEEEQAKIVLSGSLNKMPADVAYAFKQVFMKFGGLSAVDAEEYFAVMNKTGQYQEECWS